MSPESTSSELIWSPLTKPAARLWWLNKNIINFSPFARKEFTFLCAFQRNYTYTLTEQQKDSHALVRLSIFQCQHTFCKVAVDDFGNYHPTFCVASPEPAATPITYATNAITSCHSCRSCRCHSCCFSSVCVLQISCGENHYRHSAVPPVLNSVRPRGKSRGKSFYLSTKSGDLTWDCCPPWALVLAWCSLLCTVGGKLWSAQTMMWKKNSPSGDNKH